MPKQQQAVCQVQNIFKSTEREDMSSLVTIKMAKVICRAESSETVKLSILAKS